MKAAMLEWLTSPSLEEGSSNLQYFAKLIALNRGEAEVKRIGDPPVAANNAFGRVGLLPEEALHLMQMYNFAKGMIWAYQNPLLEQELRELCIREAQRSMNGTNIFLPTTEEMARFGTQRKGTKAFR